MNHSATAIFDLSPSEKLQLVEDLWDDLASTPEAVPAKSSEESLRTASSISSTVLINTSSLQVASQRNHDEPASSSSRARTAAGVVPNSSGVAPARLSQKAGKPNAAAPAASQ